MKMEVLSVQNQFQGQFGVIGSNKVKDWTSPLTSPPLPTHHRQLHNHRNHHQNNRHNHSNLKTSTSSPTSHADAVIVGENNQGIDIVDGLTPRVDGHYHGPHATQQQQEEEQSSYEQYYHYHHNYPHHHNQPNNQPISAVLEPSVIAAESTLTTTTTKQYWKNNDDNEDVVAIDPSNIDYQTPPLSSSTLLPQSLPPSQYNKSRYNRNLICCGGGGNITGGTDVIDIDATAINDLSMRLLSELRAAKSRHLACAEVSLPCDLTPRIASEIIKISEKEPCGIRGCTVYIEFEDEPNNTRRIASLKIDSNTVSTFELYLTLRHDKSGWISLLPQFIKNLTRSSSIIISPDFSLTKNKLYHSSLNFLPNDKKEIQKPRN